MSSAETAYPEALPLPAENPFAARWETPFRLPPFAAIKPEHISPAFDAALAKHKVCAFQCVMEFAFHRHCKIILKN